MVIITIILSLFSGFGFTQDSTITRLGARPSYCKDKPDIISFTYASELSDEASRLFNEKNLTSALVAGDPCFRVGTEISLFLSQGEILFLGKAFITNLERTTATKALKSKSLSSFKSSDLQNYINQHAKTPMNIIQFKMMQRYEYTVMEQKYDRLPSCFVSYRDKSDFTLDANNWEDELEQIKTGTKTAVMWSGANNCYKIGSRARIRVENINDPLGSIIPQKLYLVHLSQITQEHADLVGEPLQQLKDRLQQGKDRDGGYTTLTVFEYLAPVIRQQ